MADSTQALTARLEAVSGVTALVSTRIYPIHVPENTAFPFIVHRKISHPRTHAFGADKALGPARHQVSSVGKTVSSARAVSAAVKAALSRYRGTATGVVVQDVLLVNELEATWNEDIEAYTVEQDYIIWHEE